MRKYLAVICVMFAPVCSYAAVTSTEYVSEVVNAHALDTSNPHHVSAAQVGLGNVKNVDTTNAANITSGTVDTARLNVGTTENTVAAGNDVRFNTIPASRPTGTPPAGQVFIWVE